MTVGQMVTDQMTDQWWFSLGWDRDCGRRLKHLIIFTIVLCCCSSPHIFTLWCFI